MKIVIAPDSFKDAMPASEVCGYIYEGLVSVKPDIAGHVCPVSDGGENFTGTLSYGQAAAKRQLSKASDALGREIQVAWALLEGEQEQPDTAIIELAAACGIEALGHEERNPAQTSTRGTGLMLRHAIDKGVKRIVLGIGGSATNDAGCGIAQALGAAFYDKEDVLINEPITGGMLAQIGRVVVPDSLRQGLVPIRVACDVTNPLTGPNGAACVYGPQKGATPEQVQQLDAGLRHMAQLWRDQLGVDVQQMPGAGAAGGVGGGLVAMLGAELVPGAELVLDTLAFDERIRGADLVITGEGRLDSQSLQGKAAMAVARRCQAAGVPCYALVGSIGKGAEQAFEHGLAGYRVIGQGLSAEESIRRTGKLLESAAAELIRDLCP